MKKFGSIKKIIVIVMALIMVFGTTAAFAANNRTCTTAPEI